MKRSFDTAPRLIVYLVIGASVLLLALPYWLDWFPAQSLKENFSLADEEASAVARPVLAGFPSHSRSPLAQVTSPLSRFGSVRLETPRREMLQTFDLHARTGSGAAPAIYEATTLATGECFTGCFTGDILTEVVVIAREKRTGADALQQELIKQYGLPTEQTDNTGAAVPPTLLSPSAATAWIAHMASLPFQRQLVWTDANYHMEADIHYSSMDPAQSRAILTVHMRATTSPLNQTLSQYTVHILAPRQAVQ